MLLFALTASAQTLARPGWAGSGLGADAWWRTAVFYRLDVARFQDSDGDGTGDLKGLAERMDYVQSLGVDAVVLLAGFDAHGFDEAGFDALLHEAGGRHIRVVIGLAADTNRETLSARARQWLTRGAAGLYVQHGASTGADLSESLRDLRALAAGFPGQRAVLSDLAPVMPLRLGKSSRAATAQLVDVQITSGLDVLQREMADADMLPDSAPLLLTDARFRSANAFYAEDAAQQLGMNKILATVLLSFRGAVSLRYGQELGLAAEAGGDAPRTMQWTPANVTQKPAVPEPPKPPQDPNVFGAYVPYVRPKPQPLAKPGEVVAADPNTLKGFTTGDLREHSVKANVAVANVALEDADALSLLNYYRRLAQLHHGNSSIRNGTPHILDAHDEAALLWVRRPPAGARTAANVVVACNLGDKPLRVSVDEDLARLHIGAGTLRPLLASWTETPASQNTGSITLPPYSVFVGELFYGGH